MPAARGPKPPIARWAGRLFAAIGCAISALACAAATPPGGPAAPLPALLRPAPIGFTERTLANGLQFIAVPSHGSPTVSVQVWYHVGSRDDPPGRSGFAHLFEHLMFKSTRNLRAEQFDRLTEDVGGNNNASTGDDVTEYHESIPSNYLETLVWAEAERMSNLNVDEANFQSERAVVEEEYRQRVLASPYGRLFSIGIAPAAYLQHPYRRPTIGSIEDLDAASIGDVAAFHRTFYRPDNATLVVAGDFDPQQLDAWVDKYFGPVAKPAGPISRVTATEPAWTSDRQVSLTGPNVPLPAIALVWQAPAAGSPDAAALQVAAGLLAGGESSRLNQSLVYRQQIASQIGFDADLRDGPSLLTAYAIAAGGKSLTEIRTGLLSEIERLAARPVGVAELAKVKTQILTGALLTRETPGGLANAVATAAVIEHDPAKVNDELVALLAVSAGDVQRVVQRYLEGTHVLTIDYRASGAGAAVAAAPSAETRPASLAAPASVPASVSAPAQAQAQTQTPQPPSNDLPPPPAPPRPLTIAAPEESTLANGLRVIVARRPGVQLVSAQLLLLAGAETDPPGRAGLANLTAGLLTKGTRRRSASDMANAAEVLGGSLESGAGWNQSSLSITVSVPMLDAALALVREAATEPRLSGAELDRLRGQTIDGMTVAYTQPGTLASLAAERLRFGAGPYGHPATGTPTSLPRIHRADVLALHRTDYRPDNAVLLLAGDIDAATARALARKHFASWRKPAAPGPRAEPGDRAAATFESGLPQRTVVIDMPNSGQASVALFVPVPPRGVDRAAADVMNSVLGGGYSSRLNGEIRIKRGLSYGAGSRFDARRDGGLLYASAQTRNDAAAEVAALLSAEFDRLIAEPVPADELGARKATLIGEFSRGVETTAGLNGAVASLVAAGLPTTELGQRIGELSAVDAGDVQRYAAAQLGRGARRLVIAGEAARFAPALQAATPGGEASILRIDPGQLDFDAAGGLTRR